MDVYMTARKILIVFTMSSILSSCGLNSKPTVKPYHYKECIIDSITMQYRNMEKYRKIIADKKPTYEELLQQYDSYKIDINDWQLILDLLNTAVYDKKQYDKVKNPNGYKASVAEPDFTLFIHCLNGQKNSIFFWTGTLSIEGKWYKEDPTKRAEFNTMISKYIGPARVMDSLP